jgi:phosphatidylserine decarboxylase
MDFFESWYKDLLFTILWNITAEEGTFLEKGVESGFFAFGGSYVIMLYEEGRVELSAKARNYYKVGEVIGIGVGQS